MYLYDYVCELFSFSLVIKSKKGEQYYIALLNIIYTYETQSASIMKKRRLNKNNNVHC